jgi:DNA-binding response OmpR family regulator
MDLLLANEPLQIITPRILVCDDNELGRGLLKRLLVRRGYVVDEAIDGRSTIEAVERWGPDLLLLDLRLPDLDGSEVLRQLRRDHDVNQLPIIMVSAEHDGEVMAGCLFLGACDFVTKPIQAHVLYARIATHLDLHFADARRPRQGPALRLVH